VEVPNKLLSSQVKIREGRSMIIRDIAYFKLPWKLIEEISSRIVNANKNHACC
jgi:hypothetical protein